jgi:hypothetical protein
MQNDIEEEKIDWISTPSISVCINTHVRHKSLFKIDLCNFVGESPPTDAR